MQLLIRYRKGNDKYYIPTYDTYNRAIYVVFIYNRVVKMSVLRVFGSNNQKKLKSEVQLRVGSAWTLNFGFFRLRNPEKKLKIQSGQL